MVKFKREVSAEDKLMGKVYNSFYKTGFMNEQVYKSKKRDIWYHMLQMLSDTNTASVFENILVAYEELEYSEAILQQLIAREFKDDRIHSNSIEVYASTNPLNLKFYRCLFIVNPASLKNDKRVEIVNTLNILKTKYKDWTFVPSVMEYLHSQVTIHVEGKVRDASKHLIHEDNIVTLIVPTLEDNMYYNTNGSLRYPYLTEMYHHMRTFYGQISFIFKSKVFKDKESKKNNGSKYVKRQSFFDVGEYTSLSGEVVEIFYVKLFNGFYNPLMFFELNVVQDLLCEIESDINVLPRTKELLANTFKCYIEELEVVRKVHGNLVPPIVITKEDDSYYDEIKEKLQKLKEMQEEREEERRCNSELVDDCEDCGDEYEEVYEDSDLEVEEVYSDEISKLEELLKQREEFFEEKNSRKATAKLARYSLSINKLKSLIMGYNGVKIFGYYPHLSDILLKYTDLNDVKVSSGVVENPKQFPKSFQIITTISNDELFCTNDSFNPLDWLFPFMYRKSVVHSSNETGTTKTKDLHIPKEERYLTEEEMGIIDPHTKKSDTAAGLLASVNPFIIVKDRVEV